MIEVLYLLDWDETIYVIHALPLTTRRRKGNRLNARPRRRVLPAEPELNMSSKRKTRARTRARPTPAGREMTGEDFDALSPAEKPRIVDEIDRGTPAQRTAESRPLNPAERAQRRRFKKRLTGRPKIGKGVKTIALSIEKGLLERADAHARALDISRAQLVARGLLSVLPEAS